MSLLCICCPNRCHCVMPHSRWESERQYSHCTVSLGELESNFGNLDILLCTKTSHTENCAAHILSHQKTRNSVNTSTAANCCSEGETARKGTDLSLLSVEKKILKCSYFARKGTKRLFLLLEYDKCCKEEEGEWGSYSSKARHNIVNNLKTGPIESGITPDPSSF